MLPAWCLTTFLSLSSCILMQDTKADEQAIRDSALRYAEAFNKGDVNALVSQYTKDALLDEGEGAVLTGREEIGTRLKENFADNPGAKMTININSIRFSRGRAIETGVAVITPTKGEPIDVPYRATHQKQPDGKWLMSSVGPDVASEDATSAGPLEDLVWMIGSWKDSEEDLDLTSNVEWAKNRRFMLRTFVIHDKDGPELDITEVIGWDPANKVIRSWVFDSDGGFAQNTWSRRGDDWVISAKGTLTDGGRGSAVNFIHPIDANSFSWSSTNRDVDGTMLPDVKDIKMVRVSTPAAAGQGGQP